MRCRSPKRPRLAIPYPARAATALAAGLLIANLVGCRTVTAEAIEIPFAPEPRPAALETSVKPGINASFLDPQLDVEEYLERFEIESREVFSQRHAISDSLGIKPGQRVADVGSGTGLYLEFLSAAVGPEGRVFAVEISEPFVEHLGQRIRSLGLRNVQTHLSSERSIDLPPGSIDFAYICDTYHHFEYPRSVMGSIHKALSPRGELVLIDFHRIPGVSSDWILGHVRANQVQVIAELNRFGFDLIGELEGPDLTENYGLRFAKRSE